jgi:hypothetical protein
MSENRKLGLSKFKHLDEGALLSFLDGELTPADQKLAEEHLATCWTCRDHQHVMQGTISKFLSFRDTLQPGDLVQAAPVEQFRQRLARHAREQDERRPLRSVIWEGFQGKLSSIAAPRQAALAVVVVAAVLFATFTDVLTSTASAETLLRRAESFENAHQVGAGSVGLVSIRVEHVDAKHRTQDIGTLEFARDSNGAVYATALSAAKSLSSATPLAEDAARKQGVLVRTSGGTGTADALPQESKLPASVESYLETQNSLPDVSIAEFRKLVAGRQATSATSKREGAAYEVDYPFAANHASGIREARLVMDAKTYQPERVSILTSSADEYRFTRVASKETPRTTEWAGIFGTPSIGSSRPRSSQTVTGLTRIFPLTYAASIATEQEVAVATALHKLDACLGEEVYVFPMSDGTILVQGLVDRAERREAIRTALRGLSFPVSVQIHTPRDLGGAALFPPPDRIAAVSVLGSPSEKITVTDASNQEIPLYDEISRHVAKPGISDEELHQRVAAFSNEAVTLSRQALLHAWALRRLDSEFAERRIARLPVSAQQQAARLREDHRHAISSLTRRQTELLASVSGRPLEAVSPTEALQDSTALLRLAQQQYLLMRRLFAMSEPVEDTQASLNELFSTLRQISR